MAIARGQAMRRIPAVFAIAAAISTIASAAHADDAPVAPFSSQAEREAPPLTVRDEFGWRILSADAGAMVLTFTAAQVWQSKAVLAPYFVLSPIVHLAHGDYSGAVESLLLHVGLPLAGWYIGRAIDPPDCTPTPDRWCLDSFEWGPPLGVLAGVSLATAIDAVYLAHVERPAADLVTVTRHRLSALPALGVDPNGRVTLSLAGRF
jgi:hypothetical protein